MVGRALELDRAEHPAARARRQPLAHQPEQALGVTRHVAEQPVDLAERARGEGERALQPVLDAGQRRDPRVERRLVDADHARAELMQRPGPAARAGAEVEAELAGLRPLLQPRQRLPHLEVGPVRRVVAVLDEPRLAVDERAGAPRGGDDGVAVDQRPRAERRAGRRSREPQRLRRDVRQLLGDQRGAAVVIARVEGPVALDRPQGARALADGADRELDRVVPDVLRPGDGTRRTVSEHQPVVDGRDLAQLGDQLFDVAGRGQIARLAERAARGDLGLAHPRDSSRGQRAIARRHRRFRGSAGGQRLQSPPPTDPGFEQDPWT